MNHSLTLTLGGAADLAWAQTTVTRYHYLHRPVDPRARPMVYVIRDTSMAAPGCPDGMPAGLVMLGIPHATKCRGWWGYAGLPTQWQCVDLCRVWVHPYYQPGEHGMYTRSPGTVPGFVDRRGQFRPTVATWAISAVLASVQRDRVALWPPVYMAEPYHILLAISYSDPQYHRGTIYRESHALPMFVDAAGVPVPGSSGKYGWAWKLPTPAWDWQDLTDIRPRTMRLI
jgi:hypothetical protein